MKLILMIGVIIGSTIGGLLPMLWGGSAFSGWAVLLSTIGAIVGIWTGYKIAKYIEI